MWSNLEPILTSIRFWVVLSAIAVGLVAAWPAIRPSKANNKPSDNEAIQPGSRNKRGDRKGGGEVRIGTVK